ncbi:MAG: TIGR02300 family protein [Alphaproteobacteria bacterium]|nr:TIGR02300 family protein [Alphaproteobacteria bacterium]
MAKSELGTKRSCPKCASKFYDLNKNPAQCPVCAHGFDPEAPVKKRGKRKTVKMGADAVKTQVMASSATKGRKESDDDDDIELPEFDDLGIMEDMDDDDLEDVESIKGKPSVTSDGEDEIIKDDDDIVIDDDDVDEDE